MASVFTASYDELEGWIQDEVRFPGVVCRGQRGGGVSRVQEWLCLQRLSVVVDGDFGPATERAVTELQASSGLRWDGVVDEETWSVLTAPMASVLPQRLDASLPFGDAVLVYARAHLEAHPREVGGANRGPWVRLYMHGNQGSAFPWCAGFASFLMRQAADSLACEPPVAGSFSCDTLAGQAAEAGLLVREPEAAETPPGPGSLFLVRRVDGDWTHTGVVVAAEEETFSTIEGNTNDAGDREGYEVCARTRSYAAKDFVAL